MLIFLDWIVLDPPQQFLSALEEMNEEAGWPQVLPKLFETWIAGSDNALVTDHIKKEMGEYGFEIWARGGREIARAYAREGNPLNALSKFERLLVFSIFMHSLKIRAILRLKTLFLQITTGLG